MWQRVHYIYSAFTITKLNISLIHYASPSFQYYILLLIYLYEVAKVSMGNFQPWEGGILGSLHSDLICTFSHSCRVLQQSWVHSAPDHSRLLLYLLPPRCRCAVLSLCQWRAAFPSYILRLLPTLRRRQLVLSTAVRPWPLDGEVGQG